MNNSIEQLQSSERVAGIERFVIRAPLDTAAPALSVEAKFREFSRRPLPAPGLAFGVDAFLQEGFSYDPVESFTFWGGKVGYEHTLLTTVTLQDGIEMSEDLRRELRAMHDRTLYVSCRNVLPVHFTPFTGAIPSQFTTETFLSQKIQAEPLLMAIFKRTA